MYSKDDFLKSREPYDFIAKGKDQLEIEQRRQLVMDNAIAVGVRDFQKLYKSYLESK